MRLTNPLWYLAALILAVGSTMAAAAVAASAYDTIKTAPVTGLQERADAAGSTLAVYTDDLEPERRVACHARAKDGRRIEIDHPVPDIENRTGGTTWHLLALLERGQDDLRIACSPARKDVDDGAAYGFTVVSDYEAPARNGKGIASIGLALAAGLAAWTFWSRRTAKRERRVLGTASSD